MKKIVIATAMLMVLISCNSNKDTGYKKPTRDTMPSLIVYKSAVDTNINYGVFPRIVTDSLMYVYADTIKNNERKWDKDTAYYITYYLPIDSVTAASQKLKMYDSTGKRILYRTNPIRTEKMFVRSGWENVDSAVAQLKRLKK